MKNNSEENRFRTWLKSNYGIQDYNDYRNTQTEELAIQFAAQSVREDRESRWISVNDLFPKEKVDVLGMVKMWKLGKEVKVMSVVRYNELGFWENLSYTDMEVTHWQPLPSPPTKVVFE